MEIQALCVVRCVQVTVHVKGKTRCYECIDKPTQKSYPICTIRNTPDKPIHCIVWAKDLLFARLFGQKDIVSGILYSLCTVI